MNISRNAVISNNAKTLNSLASKRSNVDTDNENKPMGNIDSKSKMSKSFSNLTKLRIGNHEAKPNVITSITLQASNR
jgi:hypothetical protein